MLLMNVRPANKSRRRYFWNCKTSSITQSQLLLWNNANVSLYLLTRKSHLANASSFCVDLFNGEERNHSFCFSVKMYFLGVVSVHYTAGKSSHYAVIRWELWLWQGGAMKGKFVPFQIFTCALALQPSPPMFSFTSCPASPRWRPIHIFPDSSQGKEKSCRLCKHTLAWVEI